MAADHMDTMDGIQEPVEEESEADLVSAPSRLVVNADGEVDFCYAPLVFTCASGVTIQRIAVAQVSERYLVCVPNSAWHRQPTKRVLPPQFLAKPALVEVTCSHLASREEPAEDISMKLWVGYVTAELMGIMTEEEPVNYPFSMDGSSEYLPYAQSLHDVLQDHFAFLSAESGAGRGLGGSGSGVPLPLNDRVASLESLMEKMSGSLEEVLGAVRSSTKGAQPSVAPRVKLNPAATEIPRTSPDRQKKAKATAAEKFPLLDPSVVAAALGAGVSEGNLTEMQRLIGGSRLGVKKLREPALRTTIAATTAEILSESEEEPAEDFGFQEPSSPPTMEAAVSKLTELVCLL